MKIYFWNCKGLGRTSAVSQLKESIRHNLPDLVCLSETKNSSGFVGSVCKKLKFGKNWDTYDPVGKKGGLMVAWKEGVDVQQIQKTDFCLKGNEKDNLWLIFIYASTEANERKRQWEWLINMSQNWGSHWIVGGDFNDIRNST